jgi:hypothetical protein
MNIRQILERAAAAAEFVDVWEHTSPSPGASLFVGDTFADEGWRFVVSRWSVAPTLFHYDGAITRLATVVHLTPDIAEKIFKIAEAGPRGPMIV